MIGNLEVQGEDTNGPAFREGRLGAGRPTLRDRRCLRPRHRREADIEPFFWSEVLAPLRDRASFEQVTVDPGSGSVHWPTGANLAPEFLYDGEETPYGRVEIARPEAVVSADPKPR